MEITNENVKDLEFFNTTKDIKLSDGSVIEKGTEFIVEGFDDNGNFEVHFSVNENNHYAKENGEGYEFTIEQLNEFAEPTEFALHQYQVEIERSEALTTQFLDIDDWDYPDDWNGAEEKVRISSEMDYYRYNGITKNELIEELKNSDDVKKTIEEIYKADSNFDSSWSDGKDKYMVCACKDGYLAFDMIEKKDDTYTLGNIYTDKEAEKRYNFSIDKLIKEGELPRLQANRSLEKINIKIPNKFNISNDKVLERIDKIIEGVNNIKLKLRPIKGEFDFKHLESINKSLYGYLYELPRVPIDKIKECNSILNNLKKDEPSKVNNIGEFSDKTMKHINRLYENDIFQKGNINTLKEFTRYLGMAAGFNIDLSKVSSKAFELALNSYTRGDCDMLKGIIKDNTINIKPLKDIMKVFEKGIEMGR